MLPKIPLNFTETPLAKALNLSPEADAPAIGMVNSHFEMNRRDYQPMPRSHASTLGVFRRYTNGELDMEYAVGQVEHCLFLAKNGSPLNAEQEAVLSCCYPNTFSFVDYNMREYVVSTTLQLSMVECMAVSIIVAERLAASNAANLMTVAR